MHTPTISAPAARPVRPRKLNKAGKRPRVAKVTRRPRKMTGETELAKWLRLHWIDADMHRAGVRLRTDTRLHSLDLPNIAWATGLTWPAVRALVLDNEDKLTIGHHYESGDRAAKAVALHMVRAGLETMAKCYGITPNNSHNI